ncbi:MAG: alpha-amylase, partial [Muribaculaceae bacterium]|nr:alpha-amylase [Muribaculaceae bacterium]
MVDRVDGLALVNFSGKEQKVKMATTLPDGRYTDAVSGEVFKVAKGRLEGKLAPLGTYILYR